MKKLLTIAIAAAIVAPMAASAETTLYGRADVAVVNNDSDAANGDVWDVITNTSRIGVKGGEDLGNGMKAIFQFEWAVNTSEGGGLTGPANAIDGRLGFVGLTGGFGTVAVGRQWTPYYGSVDKTDIFNVNPGQATMGGLDASSNAHYLGLSRTGNAVAYVSPDFNGFSAKAAMIMDDGRTAVAVDPSDGIDAFNVSLDYNNGPLSVGFSYLDVDNGLAMADRWGLAGSYNFGNFKIIAQYEDLDDLPNTPNTGADSYAIAGQAFFGNNTLYAVYGERDLDAINTDLSNWGIGIQHNFSKATRIYADYIQQETAANTDASTFGVGLRHDF
ncbi:porin [Sedimenticola thiotaurini]|uniref:porin n=1 Tax=Sedimenticola thiotaurini TaxID=1543721 RepID=UPI00069C2F86|nr:porin [Sedimenticola thiotaurini]